MRIWLLVLLGCPASEAPEAVLPSDGDVSACDALNGDAETRTSCRMQVAAQLYEAGRDEAFGLALASVDDPGKRDLVRLQLAIQDPNRAGELCKRVETPAADEKCRQVLGRPHLRAPWTGTPPDETR